MSVAEKLKETPEEPEPWEAALEALEAAGICEGYEVTKDWLYAAFGLPIPMRGHVITSHQATYMAQTSRLKRELEKRHGFHLVAVYGLGFRVAHAREHVDIARAIREKKITEAIRRPRQILNCTREDRLTAEEAKRLESEKLRNGQVNSMLRSARKRARLQDLIES